MGPTTDAMVIAAQDAVAHADEAVEAAAVLLAEAVVEAWEDVHAHVANYRRAKAQRAYAGAVLEAVTHDRDRAVPA
jgi:hypothetical protein